MDSGAEVARRYYKELTDIQVRKTVILSKWCTLTSPWGTALIWTRSNDPQRRLLPVVTSGYHTVPQQGFIGGGGGGDLQPHPLSKPLALYTTVEVHYWVGKIKFWGWDTIVGGGKSRGAPETHILGTCGYFA